MSEKIYGDLYVEYILGSLSEPKTAELRRHLETCEECRANIEELQEVLHSIPLSLEPQAPPPDLKRRLMDEIGGRVEAPAPVGAFPAKPTPPSQFWKGWAIAATVVAVLSGLVCTGLYRAGRSQESQIAFLENEVLQLRHANQGLTIKVRELAGPDVKFLNLAGLSGFEGVAGSAFVMPSEGKAALYLHNLPALGADQAYQLWVIEANRPPYPSNVFQPSGELTELEVTLPVAADQVAVLAVTIEPLGGSQSPTGAMVAATQGS